MNKKYFSILLIWILFGGANLGAADFFITLFAGKTNLNQHDFSLSSSSPLVGKTALLNENYRLKNHFSWQVEGGKFISLPSLDFNVSLAIKRYSSTLSGEIDIELPQLLNPGQKDTLNLSLTDLKLAETGVQCSFTVNTIQTQVYKNQIGLCLALNSGHIDLLETVTVEEKLAGFNVVPEIKTHTIKTLKFSYSSVGIRCVNLFSIIKQVDIVLDITYYFLAKTKVPMDNGQFLEIPGRAIQASIGLKVNL